MVNLGTFGFDHWWKKKIIAKIPTSSRCVLDQACGTGILTFKIAQKFPACRIVGVELREEYMTLAREKAIRRHLKDVTFIIGRAEDIYLNAGFDCITSSYRPNMPRSENGSETQNGCCVATGFSLYMILSTLPGTASPACGSFTSGCCRHTAAGDIPSGESFFTNCRNCFAGPPG
jgi:SAM-dependent methyltransferase